MNPSSLKVTGAWFQVGESYSRYWNDKRIYWRKVESELVIVGSSLQALGYILQIIASNYDDGEEKRENQSKLLDQIGIELLALGNISNVIGIYFNINEQLKENDYLIITGNSLQSIGAF